MKPLRLLRSGALLASLVAPAACHLDALLHAPGRGGPGAVYPDVAALSFTTPPPSQVTAGQAITPALTVTAEDASGHTVAGFTGAVTVALGPTPSGGKLGGDTTVTAIQGVATFSNLRLGRSGTGYTLTAACCGLPPVASTGFAVVPGPATRLAFSTQPSQTMLDSIIKPPVQVTAYDGMGNVATSFADSIAVAKGKDGSAGKNATLSGHLMVLAAGGVASFTDLSINQLGTGYTLTAAFGTGPVVVESAPFDVTATPPAPGSARALSFVLQPQSAPASTTLAPVQVAAVDAAGHTVPSFTGPITVTLGTNPGGGRLSGTTQVAAVSGLATFSDLMIDKAGTGYTLTATAPGSGLAGAVSTAFDITAPPPPAPPTRVAFVGQPQTTAAGSLIAPPVQVAAVDGAGNTVTSYSGPIMVGLGANPGGGTLTGVQQVNAVNGVATFSDLSLDKTGTGYTLTASASGLAGDTSTPFAITPGPATQLLFTVQPSNALPTATIQPPVQVTAFDALGNLATNFTGFVRLTIGHDASLLGNATLSGTTSVAATGGVATFGDLSIGAPGINYTLKAAFGTSTPIAESAQFTILLP